MRANAEKLSAEALRLRLSPIGDASAGVRTEAELKYLEETIDTRLPEELRLFLQKYGGQILDALGAFRIQTTDKSGGLEGVIECFLGFQSGNVSSIRQSQVIVNEQLGFKMLPFAEGPDGSYCLFGVPPQRRSGYYYLAHDSLSEDPLFWLGDRLIPFLESIFLLQTEENESKSFHYPDTFISDQDFGLP